MGNALEVLLQSYSQEGSFGNAINYIPRLNEYEKSLFLTKAQLELVNEAYKIFETSEASRELLAPLLTKAQLPPQSQGTYPNE